MWEIFLSTRPFHQKTSSTGLSESGLSAYNIQPVYSSPSMKAESRDLA